MCRIVIFASVSLVCSSVLSSFFLSVGTQNNLLISIEQFISRIPPPPPSFFSLYVLQKTGPDGETDVVGAPGEILPGRQVL